MSCQNGFEDGSFYRTLLYDRAEGIERLDICQTCWKDQYADGGNEKKDFVAHWQGTYEAPPPPEAEPIQKNTAEDLLRELLEKKEDSFKAAIYILSAMLERKRILRLHEKLKKEGRKWFAYEFGKSGEVFTVEDPELQLAQLDAVQQQVADLMEYGLDGPPATETTDNSEEASSADDTDDESSSESSAETDSESATDSKEPSAATTESA